MSLKVPACTALVLLLLPVFPVLPILHAQTIRAEGRVLKADSTPAGGISVALHRVGRVLQGTLDSTRTDRRGRFRFEFTRDTTALYLLSARYSGIEYFSPPVHTNPELPDTAIRIVVYDTSSTAPIVLTGRDLVITRPAEDGSRSVLDLLALRNEGRSTRTSPDSQRPSWRGRLPRGTVGLQLVEGDLSPDAVSRRGDSLIVTAPLPPGEKLITVQYLLPSARRILELAFAEAVPVANVLVEEKDVVVGGGTLAFADSQIFQGRSLRRWTGAIPAGGVVRISLPGFSHDARRLLVALVGLLVVGLGVTAWFSLRRGDHGQPAMPPAQLIDRIAMLDARYLGRQGETPADEWSFYGTERARLKAQLEASLAAGRTSP